VVRGGIRTKTKELKRRRKGSKIRGTPFEGEPKRTGEKKKKYGTFLFPVWGSSWEGYLEFEKSKSTG